jgi:hypothetical protein
MTTYTNPWHKPLNSMYGPAEYETSAHPSEYRGFLVYERISGHCWDVVQHGACITQRAGPNGAKRAIDQLLELS